MTVAALIFDVDGTLAETEEAHRRAFNEIFARRGLDWKWDQSLYEALLKTTGGKERMAAYQRDYLGEVVLSPERIATIHQEKTARYNEILAEGDVAARPGVVDLISRARDAGLKLAIATTTNSPNVEGLTQAIWGAPASEIFDEIAAGDMVKAKKPAPDVFQLALEKLSLSAEVCLAFEDSKNGLLSARGAGLDVIVTPSRYTRNEDFKGAKAVLGSLEGFNWS